MILPEFYTQIFMARATTSVNLRFWSLCNLILQQAIGQLDPERRGMSVWVARCMPPSGPLQKVRSMRESVGLGTTPWKGNLEQEAMFLGAESLAGSVVTSYRPGVVQDLDEEHYRLSISRITYERSIAIYPYSIVGVSLVFLSLPASKQLFSLAASKPTTPQSTSSALCRLARAGL
ncbi:hypothetical protein [Dictyobacter kobayashii]|uniref:Uncharacterized protein n=1 Tax=Dictyobacter kobayashii TaxID=2014872 RepID=A0A402AZ24_9CHLR|nr:hypothetical protein [Dictyobacter kobayashii]GCE24317.1 hypothetical protein KDK_81170 [Dictyobacter kobayashii]